MGKTYFEKVWGKKPTALSKLLATKSAVLKGIAKSFIALNIIIIIPLCKQFRFSLYW